MNKIVFMCLLLSIGCSSNAKKKEVVVEEKKIELPKIKVSDKGPLFELAIRPAFGQKRNKEVAKTVEVYRTKTHTFLKIDFGASVVSSVFPYQARIRVAEISAHLTGAARDGFLYLRIVGVDPLPKQFTVIAENFAQRMELEVSLKATKSKKSFENDFNFAMHPGPSFSKSPYQIFLTDRFLRLSGKPDPRKRSGNANARWRSAERVDFERTMNLYSGATSIRETLQNDRQLRVGKLEKQTIDINTLPKPALAKHPWEKMIGELKGDTVIEPLAAFIPADMGYAHFHDLRTFVKMAKEFDDLSPVVQSLEGDGGTREFADYYEKQLVLERTGVAEIFGHQAAKSVAIVVGDSFVREGSDVGILFRIENKLLLETALNKFERSARAKHVKMNQFSIKVGDVDVRRIYTDDLSVNQFRASYGGVLLIANSLELVTDLVNTYKKKTRSLKDEGDFRYMRTLYPFGEKNEAGFVFLSDAFVAKVISPQTRIASLRRFQRESDILAVNYGAMLHAKLEGFLPADLKTLAASGIMAESEFFHKDGTAISYTPEKGASSKYGSARMMRPLSAFPVQNVSKSEASAYQRFQETYQSYWQKFIDPIAVQIQYDEEKKVMSAEVRILPIIDSSEYDELIELVGEASAPRYKKVNDGVEWTFAIGKEAKLRKELGSSSRMMMGLSVSWLGDWMQIGAADHSRIWDLIVSGLRFPIKSTETGEALQPGFRPLIKVVQEAPLHVAFEISNELVFAAMLTDIRSKADAAAPNMIKWDPVPEPYREQYIVTVSGKDNSLGEFSLHYVIVNGIFVIAPRLDYLKLQIDKFLTVPEMTAGQSNLGMVMTKEGWLSKAIETGVHSSAFLEAHEKSLNMMEDTVFSGKYNAEQTLNFQGILPRSPFFGTVSIKDGVPIHDILGSDSYHDFSKRKSSLTKQIDQTRSVDGSIAFDGTDNHRSLLINLEWQKR